MKKTFFFLLIFFAVKGLKAQELYTYTEPASNMPSHSISVKLTSMFEREAYSNRIMQRHMPELMFGLNKKWMVHGAFSSSNMHQKALIFESVRLYTKYRFLSLDEVHKHFRMAAFAAGSYSRNHLKYNELNLMGDQSGVQAGIIATQLWNKLAFSGTGSITELLHPKRSDKVYRQYYAFSAVNYSLSAGYLLFPVTYKDYDQTNVNLYAELLGSRNLRFNGGKFYVDVAPSLQFIFKSTGKLNLGYRFQVAGDIYRMANNSFMVSYEHLFLGALQKKKRDTKSL